MERKLRRVLNYAVLPLLLVCAPALGGEGVAVNIINDGTADIVVTVYDMSIGPNAAVLLHTRINGFTSVPVQVAPDSRGRAVLSWTAISTDSISPKCGHEDRVALDDASSLTVHADSNCSA
jgi:hypothetical protein